MCYICFFYLCLYTHASFSCFIYGKHSRFCKNIPERHQPNHCTPSTFEIASPIKYEPTQAALEFCPIHFPNERLGQDLGFGGFAFALKLPELLNRNLAAVR